MRYALTSATIFDGHRFYFDHTVIINDDQIEALVPESELAPDITRYALPNQVIAPAFIDLQVNGCGGVMFNNGVDESTLDTMHASNLRSGTTTFLPTLVTCDEGKLDKALSLAQDYRTKYGWRVPGIHLEGPFISKQKKGIHTEEFIRPIQSADIEKLLAHRDQVGMLTLAPENASPEQVAELVDAGIHVSLGHSNANCEVAEKAFAAGAQHATHLYNAMSGYKGREPGLIGAVFDSDAVSAGIIADGLHLDFVNLSIAKKLLKDRLYLITDATAAAGANLTEFEFVGRTVYVKDGKCLGSDGTIGGSMLTMNEAVRNSITYAQISPDEALRMASLYPAKAMGWDDTLGQIKPGFLANLVVLSDRYDVTAVVDQGQWTPFEDANTSC